MLFLLSECLAQTVLEHKVFHTICFGVTRPNILKMKTNWFGEMHAMVNSLASNKEQCKAAAMSFQRYWGHQQEPVGTLVIFLPVVT